MDLSTGHGIPIFSVTAHLRMLAAQGQAGCGRGRIALSTLMNVLPQRLTAKVSNTGWYANMVILVRFGKGR